MMKRGNHVSILHASGINGREYDTSSFYCCCLLLWSLTCTLKPFDLGHPESQSWGEILTPLLSPPRPCPGKSLD